MTNPYGQQPYGQPQPGYGGSPYGAPVPAPYGGPPSGGMPAAPYAQPQPGYGPPPGQQPYGMGPGMPPGGGMPGGQDIPDYKGWAIGCIFLAWIIAIFAIIKSNEVQTHKMQGNLVMAKQASDTTRTLCLVATILGSFGYLVGIIFLIIGLAAI
ncbi:MAG: hypothetical protein GEU98_20685 [Pseudonocardiaceae bacterium]|nr:hypothetical protein [Pseudonocardiaceae bacterium]